MGPRHPDEPRGRRPRNAVTRRRRSTLGRGGGRSCRPVCRRHPRNCEIDHRVPCLPRLIHDLGHPISPRPLVATDRLVARREIRGCPFFCLPRAFRSCRGPPRNPLFRRYRPPDARPPGRTPGRACPGVWACRAVYQRHRGHAFSRRTYSRLSAMPPPARAPRALWFRRG